MRVVRPGWCQLQSLRRLSWDPSPSQRRRSELWEAERSRQVANVARVQKVEVETWGLEEESVALILNKGQSTPHTAVKHLDLALGKLAGAAIVQVQPCPSCSWPCEKLISSLLA